MASVQAYSVPECIESQPLRWEVADIFRQYGPEYRRNHVLPRTHLKVMRLIEALEDLDDVQQVYSNLDITVELMVQYETA